jgi:hypothetical protein
VHLFLEMLHYGVWIVALPLIGRCDAAFWDVKTCRCARIRRDFRGLLPGC